MKIVVIEKHYIIMKIHQLRTTCIISHIKKNMQLIVSHYIALICSCYEPLHYFYMRPLYKPLHIKTNMQRLLRITSHCQNMLWFLQKFGLNVKLKYKNYK